MLIEKTTAYKVGNSCFSSIVEAQLSALEKVLSTLPLEAPEKVAGLLVDNAESVVAILEMKDDKPTRKPRKDKGTKRAKAEAINRALQDGKQ